MTDLSSLLTRFDPETATVDGIPHTSKRLSELREAFADHAAYEYALRQGDPIVYSVTSVTPGDGKGDLHYGIGIIFPGTVGDEYFLTKGHFHSWREAAEIYIGLRGSGRMLLEDEQTASSSVIELLPNSVVYVPGHTAHRTVNVGSTPLVYIGIYPAAAGHDYGEIAKRNFRSVIIRRNGEPVVMTREMYAANRKREPESHG